MSPGNGDAAFQAHQFGQHFGAAHDRQPLRAGCRKLRIVGLDRRRIDDYLRVGEIFRLMPDRHRDSELT